jgi:hypothetical protein
LIEKGTKRAGTHGQKKYVLCYMLELSADPGIDIAMAEKTLTDAQTELQISQENLNRVEAEDRQRKSEFNEIQLALLRLAKEEKTVVSVSGQI